MFTATDPGRSSRRRASSASAASSRRTPTALPEPDTWMARLGSLPLIAQPGERWLYNTGASVLGVLVARAAGVELGEVLGSRLFEPLGMADTAFWTAETDRLATSYRAVDGSLEVYDEPSGQWSRPPAFPDGAGGLVSTADDLLAFARMLLGRGERVLGPATVAEMTSDHLTAEQRASARSSSTTGVGACARR